MTAKTFVSIVFMKRFCLHFYPISSIIRAFDWLILMEYLVVHHAKGSKNGIQLNYIFIAWCTGFLPFFFDSFWILNFWREKSRVADWLRDTWLLNIHVDPIAGNAHWLKNAWSSRVHHMWPNCGKRSLVEKAWWSRASGSKCKQRFCEEGMAA